MNLIELLEDSTRQWPQKAALIDGDATVSYAELLDRVNGLAEQLGELALGTGARIGLSYGNSIEYVALTFALWRLNAVVVPVPTECTEEEFSAIASAMQLQGVLSSKSSGGARQVASDCFFTRLAPDAPVDNHGLNVAFIRFTSGTTNTRKGVVLCHETVRDRVFTANKAFQIGSGDTVMWCLPMSHHFLITIVLYLSQGATIVLARHVLPRPFIDSINRWGGTVLYAAPFQYALLARDNSGSTLPTVRLAVSTTCALTQDVAKDFKGRFGIPLKQALGLIELGLVSLNSDDPLTRWDSVGKPVPDHRVRILSADDNGYGEVAVSGPGFFDAYAAPWMPRDQVLRDGWFTTGDIGRIDAEGFLFLAGRKTAVINLAGRKVFPEEIEAVLNQHPAVNESRVFGRQHPHLGEVVEAEVVLATPVDLEGIREFCRAHLAFYKVPSRLHVVASVPRTSDTRKIRRAPATV